MTVPKIPEINPFIIGAGGVASYLLPVLVKTFPIPRLWLRDADKLEERNLDRQLFKSDQIGHHKASALLESLDGIQGLSRSSPKKAWNPENQPTPENPAWIAENRWFTEGELPPEKADLVICLADNHVARKAAIYAAESASIPCVIGGNEYYDSQALWVNPTDLYTEVCPFKRYPEIEKDTTRNPVNCQGEEQKIHPQLAIANFRCASHILDLLWMHLVVFPRMVEANKDFKKVLPIEIFTSINNCDHIQHG